MLSNRKFRVIVGENSSKFRTLNNGLPQGSVLAPLLFNLYTSDLPLTTCRKFIYADDLALSFQHDSFDTIEQCLTNDLKIMDQYFKKWRLCPNPTKTEVSCFHLNNHQKDRKLNIVFNGASIKHNYNPVYLGITLDTSLRYNQHLEKLKQKLKTRNNILHKLAGTSWGANARTLRTAGIALVYSTAEYCCPVWKDSAHVHKIDTQLNTTMRIITGTIKSTQLQWLPVLANITPPNIRRKHATKREWNKYQQSPDKFPICVDLNNIPTNRLKSRYPLWKENLDNFSKRNLWKTLWVNNEIFNKLLIVDPSQEVPGFDLPRKIWCKLNRIRTGHGRCNDMLFKWNAVPSPLCECGVAVQTIKHIVEECPISKFQGTFREIHKATADVVNWISSLKNL